jgi:Uma2 family endonuclease
MTQLLDTPVERFRKQWTKREYSELAERGVFGKQRIYLYRGELIQMPPTGTLQARGITRLNTWLVRNFDPQHVVRCQLPFDAPGESMPEPDFAVVTPEQELRRPHPNAAMLIIEVSDSSVELDQEKAFDYAAALVPDYWIVNMRDRVVEVYREPVADAAAPVGFRYASHRIFRQGESLEPLAKSDVSIGVAALTTVN